MTTLFNGMLIVLAAVLLIFGVVNVFTWYGVTAITLAMLIMGILFKSMIFVVAFATFVLLIYGMLNFPKISALTAFLFGCVGFIILFYLIKQKVNKISDYMKDVLQKFYVDASAYIISYVTNLYNQAALLKENASAAAVYTADLVSKTGSAVKTAAKNTAKSMITTAPVVYKPFETTSPTSQNFFSEYVDTSSYPLNSIELTDYSPKTTVDFAPKNTIMPTSSLSSNTTDV